MSFPIVSLAKISFVAAFVSMFVFFVGNVTPAEAQTTCASGAGQCKTINECNTLNGRIGSDTCPGQICCILNDTSGTTQGGGSTGTGTGSGAGGGSTSCQGKSFGAACTLSPPVNGNTSGVCEGSLNGQTICIPATSGTGTGTGTGTGSAAAIGSGACPSGFVNRAGVCFPQDTGLSEAPVGFLIMRFMNWLLAIFGMIAIIAFVVSGMQYLTSAGDEKTAETAKRNMKYAIIGIAVALSGWIVILAIDRALSGSWLF